ncbi:MAG: glycerol-3-phosphate acyltransferase [Candidatus Cloacimonetes bacterium]|nr:glycerol-3-phosphate acyltransferase [Candidatus Cloacimonadota bacterium]MCF7813060.1 glycerol-3-phosphate acyltransferase [Candidatus Cloacimonadota bacterium]MCF7867199.1 glycerol-3-phosphate acyltransferase [Candidatus Cloacimonadota bacterium]MCF7882643.1 glycerol-3-phosphate acyltransferase [Candidatus Cloacimonadota bacterium]
MLSIISFIILALLSYCLGCLSMAKIITKNYKSINIYKVGTGHPDTLNIYNNIGKPLGIFAGIIDFGKVFFYLVLINYILGLSAVQNWIGADIGTQNHLLILGFMMVVGHCLPVSHHFRGGRGIFTYIGFVTFFAPWPMIIVAFLALLIVGFFKQIRFAQYMIVLLPPFLTFFFTHSMSLVGKMFIAAILMGIINFIVSKKLGEI